MHDAYRTTTPTNYIAFNNSYHNRSLFTFWQTNQFKQYLPFKMLNSLKGKKKKKKVKSTVPPFLTTINSTKTYNIYTSVLCINVVFKLLL